MSKHDLDEALAKIRSEEPEPEVVKAAAGRYDSAQALAADLRALLDGEAISASLVRGLGSVWTLCAMRGDDPARLGLDGHRSLNSSNLQLDQSRQNQCSSVRF